MYSNLQLPSGPGVINALLFGLSDPAPRPTCVKEALCDSVKGAAV